MLLNIGRRLWLCQPAALSGAAFVLDENRNLPDIIVVLDFATILLAIGVDICFRPR